MLGIDSRRLKYWVDSGFIVPVYRHGDGKGTPRLFGVRNLVEAAIVSSVVAMKISPSVGGKIVKFLSELRYFDRLPTRSREGEPRYVVMKTDGSLSAVRTIDAVTHNVRHDVTVGFCRPNNRSNMFVFICLETIENNVALAICEKENVFAGNENLSAGATVAGGLTK